MINLSAGGRVLLLRCQERSGPFVDEFFPRHSDLSAFDVDPVIPEQAVKTHDCSHNPCLYPLCFWRLGPRSRQQPERARVQPGRQGRKEICRDKLGETVERVCQIGEEDGERAVSLVLGLGEGGDALAKGPYWANLMDHVGDG